MKVPVSDTLPSTSTIAPELANVSKADTSVLISTETTLLNYDFTAGALFKLTPFKGFDGVRTFELNNDNVALFTLPLIDNPVNTFPLA